MGYANPAQVTAGIHTRQFSRAFVIDDGSTRVVFVNVDCGMIDQIIKAEVRKFLKKRKKFKLCAKLTRFNWLVPIEPHLYCLFWITGLWPTQGESEIRWDVHRKECRVKRDAHAQRTGRFHAVLALWHNEQRMGSTIFWFSRRRYPPGRSLITHTNDDLIWFLMIRLFAQLFIYWRTEYRPSSR